MIRRYSDLILLPDWDTRFKYLYIPEKIGAYSFGKNRKINQDFYKNNEEWKAVRREVILRDNGCDLGIPGMFITGPIHVHHMNPLTVDDLLLRPEYCLDPEYLITVSLDTHNKIEFGLKRENNLVERFPNDTTPWRFK